MKKSAESIKSAWNKTTKTRSTLGIKLDERNPKTILFVKRNGAKSAKWEDIFMFCRVSDKSITDRREYRDKGIDSGVSDSYKKSGAKIPS